MSEPVSLQVDVLVPARLHTSVIDMNRFAVGRFGGGRIGMSADIRINISVKVWPKDRVQAKSEREAIVPYCTSFSEIDKAAAGLQITTKSSHSSTSGLVRVHRR
ncbi:MAG: hypothetical protein ACXVJJ_03035 [Halobacteriota archaeon]